MVEPAWQERLLDDLRSALEQDDDVRGLVVFGSVAASNVDQWSDVDVIVAVAGQAGGRYFPATEWLAAFGTVWAVSVIAKANSGVLLCVFEDGRELDVVVVEEDGLRQAGTWPDCPFRGPRQTLFSRSEALDYAVEAINAPPIPMALSAADAQREASQFWVSGRIAVKKVARGDVLIAAHLALDLVRSCLAMEMRLRDRAAGTRYHRHGAPSDAAALAVLTPAMQPLDREGILSMVEVAARRYHALQVEWDPGSVSPGPLLRVIEIARREAD